MKKRLKYVEAEVQSTWYDVQRNQMVTIYRIFIPDRTMSGDYRYEDRVVRVDCEENHSIWLAREQKAL
jgi:hypothetical protein